MYSLNNNSGFPVTIIYFTKNRILYKEQASSKDSFNSILENFRRNQAYKNKAILKNKYLLNGSLIRNDQLLEELIRKNNPQSFFNIKEAELSVELEELLYTGDSAYKIYQKIIQPKFNPFGLYIYTPKEEIIYSYVYPEKTINLFELNKINEGSAYCNSYNDLYISGSNESNNKDFWIINNSNYEIKKKKMPTNKNNHSMIYLNFNKNDQWVFIIGGNDKKSFYYDLRKNYFINWGDTNELYSKPAFIQIGEYLYIFDSINFQKNFIERTKIINPERKWEKLRITFDKKKINYFPSKFGLSYDSNGRILLLGGDNNQKNNTIVYEINDNTFTFSQNGTNDNAVLDDKTFYKINKKYSVCLPHNLNETKEICFIDKDEQSLLKINIECPKDNRKTKVISNLSFKEKPSIINDKGNVTIKTINLEKNEKPSSYKLYSKQQPNSSYGACNPVRSAEDVRTDNIFLLCDNCLSRNRDTLICQCCHNPFQRRNAGMNDNDYLRNYNRMNENVDNPTKENPRITIIQDEYYPLGSMNFQTYSKSGNNYCKKVYNKNYNRARDGAKVEIIYDEYIPIKADYELNKQPGGFKKYTYAKKIEQERKNEEEENNKDIKKEEMLPKNDIQNEVKDNKNNENNENDVVEYKNNEQENKDDDLFDKSQNDNVNINENENEENQNEIIIEENQNNEDNMDGDIKEKSIEMDEEDNKEKNENGEEQIENNENMNGQDANEVGNNLISQNKEIINGELPKDSLEFKDVVKDENNNNEINRQEPENKDNYFIREGEEFHSMEEDNGEEQNNSVEHIDDNNNDNDNENNAGIYENGNEIKFEGNEKNEEENVEHNNNIEENGAENENEDENKMVQFDGEENAEEGEGEDEAVVFEEGGEEEMNYNNEEGEEGEEGMNDAGCEEEMNYEGGNEEGSVVENEEQNSVIEIGHNEDENGDGEGEGEQEMNYKNEEEE